MRSSTDQPPLEQLEAVSVDEAARRVGLSRTLLYERIAAGDLPSVKIGKRRLVRLTALRAWLQRLERQPAA
jgi:excisionase family DNA binding protein